MDQLMDYVKVNIYDVTSPQIVRADQKMTIQLAHAHIASEASKFNSETVERQLCLFAKNPSNSINLIKALKIIRKPMCQHLDVANYVDLQLLIYVSSPPKDNPCFMRNTLVKLIPV
jgi:hypothetical protein